MGLGRVSGSAATDAAHNSSIPINFITGLRQKHKPADGSKTRPFF
jgi:hypothetical protein